MSSSTRHVFSFVLIFSAAVAGAPVGWTAPPARSAPRRTGDQAQIYATVVTAARVPVSGLGTADFVLREGATRLGVLNAVPATDPLSVAIVVSGFDATELPVVRRAIADLVRVLAAKNSGSRIGLMTGSGSPGSRVLMLSADAAGVDSAIGPGTGPERDVVDAIVAACDVLREAPADRRTVLAIVRPKARDGIGSARGRMLSAILAARSALWTIEVGPVTTGETSAALDDAFGEGVRVSGALREPVLVGAEIPGATSRVAARWLSQYVVTYTWPEPMVSQFSLTTRHDAGEVLTPAWTR